MYIRSGPLTPLSFLVLLLSLSFGLRPAVASSPLPQQDSPSIQAALPASGEGGDGASEYKLAVSVLNHSHADTISALVWLRSSASKHFAPAQFLLGYLYEHGRGVPVDYGKAVENYKAAAQQSQAGAENNLGGLYQYGHGVPKDISLAFEWYRASAMHGNPVAQYNLGTFYHLGYATSPDAIRAAEWFRASADQGFALAQAALSLFYFKGTGVPLDYAQAAHWARLAAQQGLPHAAMNYAYLCEHGQGVPVDYISAYVWYSRAVSLGDKSGVGRLKSVSHHLNRAQIDQAKSMLAADIPPTPQPSTSSAANGDVSLIENP